MSKADLLFLMVGMSLGLNILNIVFAWPRTKLARLKLEREQREEQE